jgi:hypothetical protein
LIPIEPVFARKSLRARAFLFLPQLDGYLPLENPESPIMTHQ